jgi:hypothetical protein
MNIAGKRNGTSVKTWTQTPLVEYSLLRSGLLSLVRQGAVHAVAPFVIYNEGAWMLKRPQDYPRTEIAERPCSRL